MIFKSCGAVMRGYIQIPQAMFNDMEKFVEYLNESYDYVMTLEQK